MHIQASVTPLSFPVNESPHKASEVRMEYSFLGSQFIFTECGVMVGKIIFNTNPPSKRVLDSQEKIFNIAYAEYKSVKNNQLHNANSDFINAQYIEALMEMIFLKNGEQIHIERTEQGTYLVHNKGNGRLSIESISPGRSTEFVLQSYMRENDLAEDDNIPRRNDSRSLGLVIKTAHSTICIGNTTETASIQSISKIFSDITLHLCEQNLYRDKAGSECAIFNINKNTSLNIPAEFAPVLRRDYIIPVMHEYSEYRFNDRRNVKKERDQISETTRYSIYNASNNYGAITTTGRIPEQAFIDGKMVYGRDELVKTVMEAALGYPIAINQLVLKGELNDTHVEYEKFLQKKNDIYLPKKIEIDNITKSIGGSWLSRKNSIELNKLALTDNHTRTLWLMRKGSFGEDLKNKLKVDPDIKAGYTHEDAMGLEMAKIMAERIMKEYTTHCALEISCEDLASLTLIIASNGCDDYGNEIFPAKIAEDAIKQMVVGGLYNQSNQIDGIKDTPFNAIKSGVGGFLTCAVPREKMISHLAAAASLRREASTFGGLNEVYNHYYGECGFSITTLGRPLNEAGNSASGLEIIKNVGTALMGLY